MPSISFTDILKSEASAGIKGRKLLDCVAGGLWAGLRGKAKQLQKPPEGFRRLLIIRPGGIGDAVMLIALIRAVRQERPGIVIDVLCEKRNSAIFRFDPALINRIICYDEKGFGEFLKGPGYDVAIDTEQWHILSGLAAAKMAPACAIGFDTRPARARLFNIAVPFGADDYEFDNFKALFAPVAKTAAALKNINATLAVPEHLRQWAQQELSANTVTLFLGGSIAIRQLDIPEAVDLIHHITALGFQPVLTGGPQEEEQGESVMQKARQSNARSFIGKTSLMETAALIGRSRLFLGCDSGPLHIAAAVGTPTVGIFGPGNRRKWAPRGEGHQVFFNDVPCAPCTRFGYTVPTCGGRYQCMRELDIDRLKKLITQTLEQL